VFALAFTSFAFGKAYWTSTDLSKASASIATLTDSAVASHSTGTLPDSVWGPAWSAQNPESLARLTKGDLRAASWVYYGKLSKSIPEDKRKNARLSYLEWLVSRWNEDKGG